MIPPVFEHRMKKNMEDEMKTPGPFKGLIGMYRSTPVMENQMEKKWTMK